jgi:hypothetical protein
MQRPLLRPLTAEELTDMEPDGSPGEPSATDGRILASNVTEQDGIYVGIVVMTCRARPDAVYTLLANLRTHPDWGGKQSGMHQRLLWLRGPEGEAVPGDRFESGGYTSYGIWRDRSLVTEAARPSVFEFKTEGAMDSDSPLHGSWLHRYEIAEIPDGCAITYRCRWRLSKSARGGHRLRRAVFCQLVLPTIWEAGLRGLTRMAETREG